MRKYGLFFVAAILSVPALAFAYYDQYQADSYIESAAEEYDEVEAAYDEAYESFSDAVAYFDDSWSAWEDLAGSAPGWQVTIAGGYYSAFGGEYNSASTDLDNASSYLGDPFDYSAEVSYYYSVQDYDNCVKNAVDLYYEYVTANSYLLNAADPISNMATIAYQFEQWLDLIE